MPHSNKGKYIYRIEDRLAVDFDRLASELSGFGRFQIFIYVLACIASFFSGAIAVIYVFVGYRNSYRCYIPSCDSTDTCYNESFLNFTTPYNWEKEQYESCTRYQSYSDNETECEPSNFDVFTTVNCSKWKYEELFESTVVTDFDLVCEHSWLASMGSTMFMTGVLIGSFVIGAISDKYGRKTALTVSVLLFDVCGILSALSTNYILFLVLQVFIGAGGINLFTVSFIIAIELIGSEWRTFCGMIIDVPFALGEATVGALAYFIRDWRWLEAAYFIPALVLLAFIRLIPESVRWLVAENKIDDAVRVVERAARVNNVPAPTYLLCTEPPETTSSCSTASSDVGSETAVANDNKKHDDYVPPLKKSSMLDILKYSNMRKRSLILIYCWVVCTLAYFGLSFNTSNLEGNIFLNFILTMLIEVPAYIACYFLLGRIGRKGTLIFVYLLGGICCVISGFLPSELSWIIVSLSLVGKFGISGAFGSIYVYTAELFPTEYRGIGVGTCSTFARVGGIIGPLIAGMGSIYQPLPLLLFGTLSMGAGCLIILLPETMNATLPQTLDESEKFGRNQPIWYFTWSSKKKNSRDDKQ